MDHTLRTAANSTTDSVSSSQSLETSQDFQMAVGDLIRTQVILFKTARSRPGGGCQQHNPPQIPPIPSPAHAELYPDYLHSLFLTWPLLSTPGPFHLLTEWPPWFANELQPVCSLLGFPHRAPCVEAPKPPFRSFCSLLQMSDGFPIS